MDFWLIVWDKLEPFPITVVCLSYFHQKGIMINNDVYDYKTFLSIVKFFHKKSIRNLKFVSWFKKNRVFQFSSFIKILITFIWLKNSQEILLCRKSDKSIQVLSYTERDWLKRVSCQLHNSNLSNHVMHLCKWR